MGICLFIIWNFITTFLLFFIKTTWIVFLNHDFCFELLTGNDILNSGSFALSDRRVPPHVRLERHSQRHQGLIYRPTDCQRDLRYSRRYNICR